MFRALFISISDTRSCGTGDSHNTCLTLEVVSILFNLIINGVYTPLTGSGQNKTKQNNSKEQTKHLQIKAAPRPLHTHARTHTVHIRKNKLTRNPQKRRDETNEQPNFFQNECTFQSHFSNKHRG